MDLSERIRPSDDVVARIVSGEMVLMDLASGDYFGLNEVGTVIWQFLEDEGKDIRGICDCVEAQFDAPRDVIEGDVLELIAQLLDQGLLKKS